MSMRFPPRRIWVFAALVTFAVGTLAQDRLIINVPKARQSRSNQQVIHYQPTGSVRHSEQRSYSAAQSRQSVRDAQSRREVQGAGDRRTRSAQTRREVQMAEGRTHGRATDRHGSVRLDTIR